MGRNFGDGFVFTSQFDGTIENFYSGQLITYSGPVNDVTIGNDLITFDTTNGHSYAIKLAGNYDSSYPIVTGNSVESLVAACYCRGTMVLIDKGAVAIENLAIGDAIITASGARRPVKWLGYRLIDTTAYPNPKAAWPVCVLARAFGEN